MGISKLTSGNQIDFNALINPEKPCAVFMIVPDEDTSRHVIASLFVNQCYNNLVETSSQFPNQELPQRVHFILDEFGNMVRIPAMDTKITVGAGRNLLFSLFVQDLNQLDTKYDNAAKTIRSNCNNLVYINSLDKDTNEYISAVLGNETVSYETYSGELSAWLKNRNVNVEAKPLMTATQLSKMKFGETVIKRQRAEPIKTKFEPFYKLKIKPTSIYDVEMDLQKVDLNDTMFPISMYYDIINWNDSTAENNLPKQSAPMRNRPQTQDGRPTGITHKDLERMKQMALEREGQAPASAPSTASRPSLSSAPDTASHTAPAPAPHTAPAPASHTAPVPASHTVPALAPHTAPVPASHTAPVPASPTAPAPATPASHTAPAPASHTATSADSTSPKSAFDRFSEICDFISKSYPDFGEAYKAAVYDECINIAHKLKTVRKIDAETEEFIIAYLSQY